MGIDTGVMSNQETAAQPLVEVTVSEAVECTGVSNKTIRRWISKGHVPARRVPTVHGDQWVLSLAALEERAAQLGKGVGKQEDDHGQEEGPQEGPHTPPHDWLPVRQEVWEATVAQLANLHEAGRELAEARERAAKAETEVFFLRERLTEMREKIKSEQAQQEKLEQQEQQQQEQEQRKRGWWRRRRD